MLIQRRIRTPDATMPRPTYVGVRPTSDGGTALLVRGKPTGGFALIAYPVHTVIPE